MKLCSARTSAAPDARNWLRGNGSYANHSATGLTAEFAWSDGAVSSFLGGKTSLLVMSGSEAHPSAGNGIGYHLRLPLVLEDDQAKQLATALNRFEMNAVDSAPFIGAWCARSGGEVAFTGFWPNGIYKRGAAANIACWCMARSRMARQVIGNWLAAGDANGRLVCVRK